MLWNIIFEFDFIVNTTKFIYYGVGGDFEGEKNNEEVTC